MHRTNVVLPAPLGPRTARMTPWSATRSKPSSATVFPKRLTTSEASIIGVIACRPLLSHQRGSVRHLYMDDGSRSRNVTRDHRDWLTARFEEARTHLRAVAYRMLGSDTEAEDAVQETWLRLARAEPDGVEDLTAWLTTVVARVCLDRLRSRQARLEEPAADYPIAFIAEHDERLDPEEQALLAETVGSALLIVLDRLAPDERDEVVLPDVVARPDETAVRLGAPTETYGAEAVARAARGRARGARLGLIDGTVGLVYAPGGRARIAFYFAITDGRIAAINMIADPERVRDLDITLLDG